MLPQKNVRSRSRKLRWEGERQTSPTSSPRNVTRNKREINCRGLNSQNEKGLCTAETHAHTENVWVKISKISTHVLSAVINYHNVFKTIIKQPLSGIITAYDAVYCMLSFFENSPPCVLSCCFWVFIEMIFVYYLFWFRLFLCHSRVFSVLRPDNETKRDLMRLGLASPFCFLSPSNVSLVFGIFSPTNFIVLTARELRVEEACCLVIDWM